MFLDFFFALTVLSIKIPNQTRKEIFSLLHHQHFPSASRALLWIKSKGSRTLRCAKIHFTRFCMRFTPGVYFVVIENGQTFCLLQLEGLSQKGEKHQLECQTYLRCPRQTSKNAQKSAANGDAFKIYRRTCEFSPGSFPRPP